MPCVLVVLALLAPRVVMFFIWLLTPWFGQAFQSAVYPVLGFLFMPYTTLAYLAAMLNNDRQIDGGWILLLVLAVVVDVAHWGGMRFRRR